MTILVTGGAGYIGSHACVELINAGYDVVVVDNFDNSSPEVLHRIYEVTGRLPHRAVAYIRDRALIEQIIEHHKCTAVMHFAGINASGPSFANPLHYYDCNVLGTLRLLEAMKATGVKTLVYSSSAAVYGTPEFLPYTENHPLSPTSPYGRTKLFIEDMLRDLYASDNSWKIAMPRYFNPVGAHESGLLGEGPKGIPTNLMPMLAEVASGKRERLTIFGNDYPTPDGTCIRDYVHVTDIALGHLKALKKLNEPACFAVNLGTGRGHSVLEVVAAFEQASGQQIPYEFTERRPGDVAEYYADASFAHRFLGWDAKKSLEDICRDCWNWWQNNPQGYN